MHALACRLFDILDDISTCRHDTNHFSYSLFTQNCHKFREQKENSIKFQLFIYYASYVRYLSVEFSMPLVVNSNMNALQWTKSTLFTFKCCVSTAINYNQTHSSLSDQNRLDKQESEIGSSTLPPRSLLIENTLEHLSMSSWLVIFCSQPYSHLRYSSLSSFNLSSLNFKFCDLIWDFVMCAVVALE